MQEIVSRVNTVIIKTDEEFEKSGTVLDGIDDRMKDVGAHYDEECSDRNRRHKESTTARSSLLKPLNDARDVWRKKMADYSKILQDRIDEEQKRVDDIARRKSEDDKINLAAELEKQGSVKQAEAILEDTTPPIVMAPKIIAPTSGASVTKVWKGVLEDLKAVCVEIAKGTAPPMLLQVDQSSLDKFAVSTGGSMKVNGIRFHQVLKVGRVGKRK